MFRYILGSSLANLSLGKKALDLKAQDAARVRELGSAHEAYSIACYGSKSTPFTNRFSMSYSTDAKIISREYRVAQSENGFKISKTRTDTSDRGNRRFDSSYELNTAEGTIAQSSQSHWKTAVHLYALTTIIKKELKKELKDPARHGRLKNQFFKELLDRMDSVDSTMEQKGAHLKQLDPEALTHLVSDLYRERSGIFKYSNVVCNLVNSAHTEKGRARLLAEADSAIENLAREQERAAAYERCKPAYESLSKASQKLYSKVSLTHSKFTADDDEIVDLQSGDATLKVENPFSDSSWNPSSFPKCKVFFPDGKTLYFVCHSTGFIEIRDITDEKTEQLHKFEVDLSEESRQRALEKAALFNQVIELLEGASRM